MVFAVSIPKFNKSASFAEETQRSPITGTRLYKMFMYRQQILILRFLKQKNGLCSQDLVTFGTVRPVIMKVAGISYILQLQLLLLLILRNMMDIILLFMRYRYEQKEKLSLIVLVCLVLLVTVIGYQKYHENIRPTKESSPASTVETEPISSQKE